MKISFILYTSSLLLRNPEMKFQFFFLRNFNVFIELYEATTRFSLFHYTALMMMMMMMADAVVAVFG